MFQPAPNHIAAQPNKLFEYMSAGLPLIHSDFPLWRSLSEENECGIAVDPTNAGAIAKAIDWVLTHPVEAEAMDRRGRQAVERTYNWERESARLLEVYEGLRR